MQRNEITPALLAVLILVLVTGRIYEQVTMISFSKADWICTQKQEYEVLEFLPEENAVRKLLTKVSYCTQYTKIRNIEHG